MQSIAKIHFRNDKLNISCDIDKSIIKNHRAFHSSNKLEHKSSVHVYFFFVFLFMSLAVNSFSHQTNNLTMGRTHPFYYTLLKHLKMNQKCGLCERHKTYSLQHIKLTDSCRSNLDLKWFWHRSNYQLYINYNDPKSNVSFKFIQSLRANFKLKTNRKESFIYLCNRFGSNLQLEKAINLYENI